jgi:hypothetical protein
MSGYGQMQRAPAQQKTAYSGSADHRTAVGDRAPATEPLSQSLNQSPRAQSLLQMRQALDEGPRVQSQLALQRALNRTRAPQANEGEQPEQDARSEPAQLAAMPDEADSLPTPVQKKPNATGLPDQLKAGVESLSGLSMDDVRVHTNSSKPGAVQAHAYAQGTDIHLAPGQEQHLPHEAWHVVQQKQGRVKPTLQLKGVAINDDAGLRGRSRGGIVQRMPPKKDQGATEGTTEEKKPTESKEDNVVSSITANWKQDKKRFDMEEWECAGFTGIFTVTFGKAEDNDPSKYLFKQIWKYKAILNGEVLDEAEGEDIEEDFDYVKRNGKLLEAKDDPGVESSFSKDDKIVYSFESTLVVYKKDDPSVIVGAYGPKTGIIAGSHPRYVVSLFG